MLLFKPQHREPILEGRKTQTRRLWKRPRVRVGAEHWATTQLFDSNAHFARVRIVALRQELLGEITTRDAKAEGYASINRFLDAFFEINGSHGTRTLVWVVEFEVVAA